MTENSNVFKKFFSNRRNVIVLASVAAVLFVLTAVGFGIFNASTRHGGAPSASLLPTEPVEFEFDKGTEVKGLDISGKNMAEAKEFLEQNRRHFIDPLDLTVDIMGETEHYTQDDFAFNVDIDGTLNQIKSDAESGKLTNNIKYTVNSSVDPDSVSNKVEEICGKYNSDPVNAYVSKFTPYGKTRFEYAEEQDGYYVDSENLNEQLSAFFASGESMGKVDAVTHEAEAEVTVDFLKKNIVKLSDYETYSTNTDDATHNMKLSLSKCNGSVIAPGETWSFNECTGDSNLESNGYKSGHVISENKITDGIGGGICQSSSTIYNAAIRSNMTVVERYNHKWASGYVPTGFDATIDYPNLDLVLQNNSNYQMFLECKVDGNTLHACFWGFHSPEYDEILTRNELGESNKSGYSVRAWRVYYKDGEKLYEEELPSSDYDPENGVVFYSADL